MKITAVIGGAVKMASLGIIRAEEEQRMGCPPLFPSEILLVLFFNPWLIALLLYTEVYDVVVFYFERPCFTPHLTPPCSATDAAAACFFISTCHCLLAAEPRPVQDWCRLFQSVFRVKEAKWSLWTRRRLGARFSSDGINLCLWSWQPPKRFRANGTSRFSVTDWIFITRHPGWLCAFLPTVSCLFPPAAPYLYFCLLLFSLYFISLLVFGLWMYFFFFF